MSYVQIGAVLAANNAYSFRRWSPMTLRRTGDRPPLLQMHFRLFSRGFLGAPPLRSPKLSQPRIKSLPLGGLGSLGPLALKVPIMVVCPGFVGWICDRRQKFPRFFSILVTLLRRSLLTRYGVLLPLRFFHVNAEVVDCVPRFFTGI